MDRDCGKCYEIERLLEENYLLRNEISDLNKDIEEYKKRNSDLVDVVFEKDDIIYDYIQAEKEYRNEDIRLERENIRLRKKMNEYKEYVDKKSKEDSFLLDRINQLRYENNVLFNNRVAIEVDMKRVKKENERLSEMIAENLLTIASLTRQLEEKNKEDNNNE